MARELKFGDVQEADIVDLAHDGRGVARVDGKAIFITGALPGERVRWDGQRLTILTASTDRARPICRYFGDCGGCAAQHMSRRLYSEWKRDSLVAAIV